jgi:hypothetical protein
MARRSANGIDEKTLSKGQLRKLNALRKSLGGEIADRAFAEWLAKSDGAPAGGADRNAELIAETLSQLANDGKLMIPRGGYLVRRGRGRMVVERNAGDE